MFDFRAKLNTSVNTARYRTGFSIDQMAPRAAEAYLTLTSLRTRLCSSSRQETNSRARRKGRRRTGSDVRMASTARGGSGTVDRARIHIILGIGLRSQRTSGGTINESRPFLLQDV